MTHNSGFKVAVLFKGEYYSNRFVDLLLCPIADNLFT